MRRILRTAAVILLCLAVVLTSGCRAVKSIKTKQLKVGVEGIEGVFNPFYAESEADKQINSQIFLPIQRRTGDNRLVNLCGGISYEYSGNTGVKYTVTIRDDMFFSDGKPVTIDDVIFFYYFIADATYDGVYSDWYLNDIVGLKEYYFDDKNYQSSIESIEERVAANYTVKTIETADYIEYLVATGIEGRFNGDLNSASPTGASWRDYASKLGYSEALSDLGASPSESQVMRLIARVEAETNPLSYDPETWYRDKLYKEYINKNYENGIDVTEISGIKKVNDYTCTVQFNSRNINAVSRLNALVVSKAYYSVDYVKGQADKVKQMTGFAVGSGSYTVIDHSNNEVSLTANDYYFDGKPAFGSLKFIDLAAKEEDPGQSVLNGKVDVVTTTATAELINKLTADKVKYYVSDKDSYTSLFFNTRTVDNFLRKALCGLASGVKSSVESAVGTYYTVPYRPLSVRFDEYPANLTQPYYTESSYSAYEIVNGTPNKAFTAYYLSGADELTVAALNEYKTLLSKKGITLNIVVTDAAGLDAAITSGKADIWIDFVPDGATSDKFDYYNSAGTLNKTAVNDTKINELTAGIRSAIGLSARASMVSNLLDQVMEQAVEFPLYQLQLVTIYNTDTIDPASFGDSFDYDGFEYALPVLK